MIRKSTLFILYIVSYIPLFLILAIQNVNDKLTYDSKRVIVVSELIHSNKIPLILISIAIGAFLFYIIFSYINWKFGFDNPEKVKLIRNSGIEYLSYLATYILPYIGLKFEPWNNLLASIILFFLIGFIYTKTNLIYANPTLALMGYYIYEVELVSGELRTVISKGSITKDTFFSFKLISDNVYFIKKV